MDMGHDDLEQLPQKDRNQESIEQIMAFLWKQIRRKQIMESTYAKQNKNRINMLLIDREE